MDNNSTPQSSSGFERTALPLPLKTLAGFLLAVVAVLIVAVLSYQSLQSAVTSSQNLAKTIEVLAQLDGVLSTLKDAETGQRGYLLTDNDTYLEPYTDAKAALANELRAMHGLLTDRPEQMRRLEALENFANVKMAELESTVVAQQAGQHSKALAIVNTDRGKIYMDRIRGTVAEMAGAERQLIIQRSRESQAAATLSLGITWGGSAVLLVLIAAAMVFASREYRAAQALAWIRAGQMGLSETMQGDQPLDKLGSKLLSYLASFSKAQVGAVYIA
jgi:CHASE3 domain sensor protein